MKNTDYKIYDFYGESFPHNDWTGKIARAKFNELMKVKGERLIELKNLLSLKNIDLDYSIDSLQKLNDFICEELDSYKPNLDNTIPSFNRYAVTPYFRSLTIDCTLYLGELLIAIDFEKYKWDVYKSSQKRLLHKFYPSVVIGKKQSIFASSIYLYFIQYLGGFEENKSRLIDIYDRGRQDLNPLGE
jgi:hypothetical protein